MKYFLETLGCKLNQAETEIIARQFLQAGHQPVERIEDADIFILNTCTVTQTADAKSRHLIRQARRHNPLIRIVVTGCYAERAPLELAKLEIADLISGNDGKPTLLKRLQKEGYLINPSQNSVINARPALRTRAFIKIQDGCHNYCAYCIVPYVRRTENSVPADEVINQVEQRLVDNYKEVVFTGTRIGAYDSNGLRLKDLIERILAETEIPRLRLSSLQPQEISLELLKLWHNDRLCPHFHLSLQSGSNTVLKHMRRRYTTSTYEKTVTLIRNMIPSVAITTDIIVGFPGETDEEFRESFEFCQRMNFSRIHVFPFSSRHGTEAAQMSEQVPDKIKKERTRLMLSLAEQSLRRFREQFSGDELDVLWEKQTGQGVWSGITGNYLRVYKKDNRDLNNKVSPVRMD